MASLGSLVIELAANTARLQSDMGKAVGIVEKGAAGIKKAFDFISAGVGGGLIGAAFIGAAKHASEMGDALNKAAIKAGVSGRTISELSYAAKLADVDLGGLSIGLKKMEVALSQASTGAKEPLTALAALGLAFKDIKELKPDAQFALIGDRISQLKDPADKARAATELFGKAGADLLPLFAEGAAGIAKARAEAEKLGFSFSDEQLKKLSDQNDAVKRLSASWDSFWVKMIARASDAGVSNFLDRIGGNASTTLQRKDAQQLQDFMNVFAADKNFVQPGSALDKLNAQFELNGNLHPELGGRGARGTHATSYAAATAAADAAAEQQKYVDQFGKGIDDIDAMMAKSADDELKAANDSWSDQMLAWQAFEDDRAKAEAETNHQIELWRDEQAHKLSEGAQIFKDAWMNAIDDMINRGKLDFGELFKYIVVEFEKRGIAKLFDQMFQGQSSSSGGGGGFGSILGSVIGGLFGGGGGSGAEDFVNTFGPGKASGGSVTPGTIYPVGEHGVELFRTSVPGSIIPNNALGGNITIAPVTNIDARGATTDVIAALPRILREQREGTIALAVERLKRKHYGPIQTA